MAAWTALLACWLPACLPPAMAIRGSEVRAAPHSQDAANRSPAETPAPDNDPGWPFIRGPHFDGHAAGAALADRWPAEGPPVLWTLPLGQGYSSFAAWDDRVATQYQTLGGQYVVCLRADSGQVIWRHRYGPPYDPVGVYPGPRATPTYAEGRIYFVSPAAELGCLDAQSGRRLWLVDLKQRFGTRGTDFGYSCSPTVVDGKVVLPLGGPQAGMIALDARDGAVVWTAGDDAASYTPAYPITFQGRRLVLGYMQNALVCHDLETGEVQWRRELSSGYDEHSAWPIYREPYLWITSPFQAGSELLRLTGNPGQPIETVRKSRLMSNDIFSSVLWDGAVYGFDVREAQAKTHRSTRGRFRCLDFLSGDEHWAIGDDRPRRDTESGTSDSSDDDVGKRIGHATVIVADGKLLLMNDLGQLILARATSQRYEELGRVSVLGGEICWTQPALHRGRLFVRNQSRAACVYVGEPSELTAGQRQRVLRAADIPQSEYVDVAAMLLGVEPEYAFDIPTPEMLGRWYAISLFGILGGGWLVVAFIAVPLRRRVSVVWLRRVYWLLTMLLGALGTTLISSWLGEFVFTWPVTLFSALQAVVWELEPRKASATRWARARTALVLAGFAACCLLYFLLCRRLSLVFEWVFLCGFAAAMPMSLAGRFWWRTRRGRWLWEAVMTAAAFTAFYWASAAVLWLRAG